MSYQKTESHDEYLKIVERYKDYEAGTYESMTLKEKMDFLDGVHTENIPLFDEDGDDMDTADDYYSIRDEFLEQPEQFSLNDILSFLEMLDDSCCQPSFMETITKIIHNIVRHYQQEGVVFLFSNLNKVPEKGIRFGLFVNIYLLIKDDMTYQFINDAIGSVPSDTVGLIHKLLSGKDMPEVPEKDGQTGRFPVFDECGDETVLERKRELEKMILPLLT